ncbi:MAG: CPBP family intramembrane glutamic endopeptidase [Atopobium sp.]|uniref:CPBP family intramembrane glutamic endopeptidase n=1 Tax=Atopobium sp. TaxID=1872650 RepID=UPI002A75CC21|nr:CPBP family intramembrane glutamic endopeptidase [Atopobium sp.]MDY2788016.1 CPBP family intramembrane glutamic endopeptidase [Atopobium sp.]
MLVPAIGVVIVRFVTKEGFRDSSFIAPVEFKRTLKYWMLGYFGPFLLIVIGAMLYHLIMPESFDFHMSYLKGTIPQLQKIDPLAQGIPMILGAAIIAPVANIVTCFGEEWGWRGYLLPKLLEGYHIVPSLIVSGVIWSLWHAPLTLFGHNYGLGYPGYPVTGIIAMCCYCTIIGVFMSFVTLKSGSCIPAALAHGSLNGTALASLAFIKGMWSPFIGPVPVGIIGGSGFIVAAIILVGILFREERKAGL